MLQFHLLSEVINVPVNDLCIISTDVSVFYTEATDLILTLYEADEETQDQQQLPAALS